MHGLRFGNNCCCRIGFDISNGTLLLSSYGAAVRGYAFDRGTLHIAANCRMCNIMVKTGGNALTIHSDVFAGGIARDMGFGTANGTVKTADLAGLAVRHAAFTSGTLTPLRGHSACNKTVTLADYASTAVSDYAFAGGVGTANGRCTSS